MLCNVNWPHCIYSTHQPDTALTSLLLVFTTICVAFIMRLARQSFYFGRPVRGVLGDFSVLIAIIVAAGMKYIFFDDVFIAVGYCAYPFSVLGFIRKRQICRSTERINGRNARSHKGDSVCFRRWKAG